MPSIRLQVMDAALYADPTTFDLIEWVAKYDGVTMIEVRLP